MKKIILKISILLIVFFLGTSIVDAASFTLSAGSKNISKGSSTKLTIKGSDVTGRFNISSSNSSVVSISEDRAWIENDSYTITLSALSVGTSTITVTPVGVSDGNGNAANLSAKTIKITVSLPREKSSDNTLKSLSVDGYELSPQFNKDTLDYTVSVPEGTESVKVSATATSKYASISGTGTKEVTEGINNLSIVVKSETGVERIYNLVINVVDQNPINVNVDNINYTIIKLRNNYNCPELFTESEIVIDNIPIPACTNELINYTLVGLKQEDGKVVSFKYDNGKYTLYKELVSTNIKLINEAYDGVVKGLNETKIEIDGEEYQAFRFSKSSKNYVIYGMNIATGEKGLYVYDSINKTFSSYDTEYIDYLTKQNEIYLYVIIAFGFGLFLAIICIFLLNKNNKKIKRKIKNKELKEENNNVEKNNNEIEETTKTEENNEDNNILEEKIEDNNLFEDSQKKKSKK